MPKIATAGDQEVQLDRRRKDRRGSDAPPAKQFNAPRRKQQRRRQIDPTTCERDYNLDEITFMQALDAYKRSSGRMFPTCSEILEVIRDLGYVKLNDEERDMLRSIASVEEGLTADTDLETDFECDESLIDDEADDL